MPKKNMCLCGRKSCDDLLLLFFFWGGGGVGILESVLFGWRCKARKEQGLVQCVGSSNFGTLE